MQLRRDVIRTGPIENGDTADTDTREGKMDTIKIVIKTFAGVAFYVSWQILIMLHTASLF